MKFRNIPQFPFSGYRINVGLDSLIYHLDRYKKRQNEDGYKFELNPDFQRGNVWTKKQQISYVEYILKGGQGARDIKFNHPNWNSDYKADMTCIDGLQRLTACLAFLNDEIKAFDTYYSEFEDNIHSLTDLIFEVYSLDRKELLQFYIDLNSGGTVHKKSDIDKVKELLGKEK